MTPYERGLEKSLQDEQPPVPPKEEDAAAFNARVQWLQSEGTQELVKWLTNESNTLLTDSVSLALNNHQSPNEKQIVKKLTEVATLRKVIEYATRNRTKS